MQEKDKRKKVTLSMYDEDIERLNAASKRSGCNKSEYVRRMLSWSIPKPIPDKRFWDLMNELFAVYLMTMKETANQAV